MMSMLWPCFTFICWNVITNARIGGCLKYDLSDLESLRSTTFDLRYTRVGIKQIGGKTFFIEASKN